jgi:CRP-like cAMP-binding protein
MDEGRSVLYNLPILRFLPPEVKKLVVDSFVPVSFVFGQPIVREGEAADAFCVLVAGQARVVKQGAHGEEMALTSLRPGDNFGEMALLEDTNRTATVLASSEVAAFRLDKSVFNALLRDYPEIRTYLELQIKHRHLQDFFHLY